MNLGARLKQARELARMKQADLARRSGVSQPTISDIECGEQQESRKIPQLAKALGVSPHWLATGEGPMAPDQAVIDDNPADRYAFVTRVRGAVLSAGGGAVAWEHEEVDGSHAFTRAWLQRKGLAPANCRILTVHGDSMIEELHDGNVVLIDLADTRVQTGKVYAISVDGEERIKRLFRLADGSLRIVSDNPDKVRYPDEIVRPEHLEHVRVLGRMRWHAGDVD